MNIKPILIVKLGRTLKSLQDSQGDFDDWIIARMALPQDKFQNVHPFLSEHLPDPAEFSGIVLTGAHANVTENRDWSARTAEWIPQIVKARVPMLGICYGHQLIAHALGGKVDFNPNGAEFGSVKILCQPNYQNDVLFGHLPPQFDAFVTHSQSVVQLPHGARVLAKSIKEPVQAYFFPPLTWGVQFHPEFNQKITAAYIQATTQKLLAEGQDPARLITGLQETPYSHTVLKRFAEIVSNKR